MSFYRPILTVVFCCSIIQVSAQSGAWDNLSEKKKDYNRKKTSLQKGFTQWKKHLQDWGLDENYNHALAVGARLNTDGWSGMVFYEKRKQKTNLQFYQLSFSEVKHEKQVKQLRKNAFPELGMNTAFVFGKVNNLYTLNAGIGREQLLLPGVLEGNIMVSLRTQVGASLALLKPYYLDLVYVDNITGAETLQRERYTEDNANKFLNADYIQGSAGFTKGLANIKPVPGGYIDIALAIEPVKHSTLVKTVTLGAAFSLYGQSLPIMADQKAYPFIAQLYAGVNVGKRWGGISINRR